MATIAFSFRFTFMHLADPFIQSEETTAIHHRANNNQCAMPGLLAS